MDLHADKDASVQIKIQDISGRTVKWIQSHVHTGANSIDLDLEHLSDGLYTVVIEMDQLPVGNSRFIIRH